MIDQIMSAFGRLTKAGAEKMALAGLSAAEKDLIHQIVDRRLTYLSLSKLASLARETRRVESQKIAGSFIEAGCALGGSTILLASLKGVDRLMSVYDVFGIIPPPTKEDTPEVHERYRTILEGKSPGIGGDRYYGYIANLYDIVHENLRSFDIETQRQHVDLIKGLLQDTMVIEQPVALAHVDVDWYEPVKICLERIFPHLVIGGSIILDDYHDWGGCRKATDEYLRLRVGEFTLDDSTGSMKITRTR